MSAMRPAKTGTWTRKAVQLSAGIVLMLASTSQAAPAMVETIVVTAEPMMSARAMALDKAIGLRLTPRGRAFLARESMLLIDGTVQTADIAAAADRNCAAVLGACRGNDPRKLAFFLFARAVSGWNSVFDSRIDRAIFTKAVARAQPLALRGDFAGFRTAVVANLPPRQRAAFAVVKARSDRIRDAMCATLKSLGIPDGCVYKASN
jgi:hypothetical protein